MSLRLPLFHFFLFLYFLDYHWIFFLHFSFFPFCCKLSFTFFSIFTSLIVYSFLRLSVNSMSFGPFVPRFLFAVLIPFSGSSAAHFSSRLLSVQFSLAATFSSFFLSYFCLCEVSYFPFSF